MRRSRVVLALATVTVALGAAPASAGKPPPPVFSVSGATLVEGYGPAFAEVTRTGNLKKAASVTLTTTASDLPDAASAGEYVAGSQVVSFGRNVASVLVPVDAVNDTAAEGDETFRAVLSSPSAGSVGVPAYVVVVDDDQNGTYVVGPGESLLMIAGTLGGCNDLAATLVDAAGALLRPLASGVACTVPRMTFSSQAWANTGGSPVAVRFALTDLTCGATYYSDGTAAGGAYDHASAWDSEELDTSTGVAVNDAGGSCTAAGADRQPTAADAGNLQVAGVYVLPYVVV